MARKRASMREGPLAELFRKTEAAQRAEGTPQETADLSTLPSQTKRAAILLYRIGKGLAK